MVVPNRVGVYGSQYLAIKLGLSYKKKIQTITISKSHLKALDQPSEHCTNDIQTSSASACIANFIEGEMGCVTKIHGIVSENMTCNSSSQLNALTTMSHQFEEADANTIYDITGCLAPCKKDEYHNMVEEEMVETRKGPHETHLDFRMMVGSYQEMEQYLLYDFDSFIADVGGFMGLLLGFSVLSIYNELVDIIMDKCKLGQIFGKTDKPVYSKKKLPNWANCAPTRPLQIKHRRVVVPKPSGW